MKLVKHTSSRDKPNSVIVSEGHYIVTEIDDHILTLTEVDAPPTSSPFFERYISIQPFGLFCVYGTSMTDLTVELIK